MWLRSLKLWIAKVAATTSIQDATQIKTSYPGLKLRKTGSRSLLDILLQSLGPKYRNMLIIEMKFLTANGFS